MCVGYTPSSAVAGGGVMFGVPVPSPQSIANPGCLLVAVFVAQFVHAQVPLTVDVNPEATMLMDVGYGVSSSNVVLASTDACVVSEWSYTFTVYVPCGPFTI